MSDKQLLLILGGARSGKSTYAEQLARELGERVLYVATATASDGEMAERIAAHRRARPSSWDTLEASRGVGEAICQHGGAYDAVLVDCLTLLVTHRVLDVGDHESADVILRAAAEHVEGEIEGLLRAYERMNTAFLLVSNEVGQGLVPPYPLGRAYRDLLGRVNQVFASHADEVYLLVAGIPLPIRRLRAALLEGSHGL